MLVRSVLFILILFVSFFTPAEVFAQVHNRPVSTITLSPSPTTPGTNLSYYSDPVTVTLQATADTGYTIANIYYKLDGGPQQTYSAPFTVSGTGSHSVEVWSVDNSGIEELPRKNKSFIIDPQQGTINSIVQNTETGNTLDISVNFDNFDAYMSQLFNNDCYNDSGAHFRLYNAVTGALVSSQSGGAHCGKLGDGNNWLAFPPVVLPTGMYFIYYHGSNGSEWITDTYSYTAPVPHSKPVTTASLSPSPTSPGTGLTIYSDPVTVTLTPLADSGFSIANTYYRVDGGATQTYSGPFTVTGSGTHSVEYWSVDNTGLQELPHKNLSFVIEPQHGIINSIVQNGTSIEVSVRFDNFATYTSQLFNNDCYNDPGASFELYNANTGARVSARTGGATCGNLGNGNNWLAFLPLQLPTGTYFIHYHGGNGSEWITEDFSYTEPVPVHNRPSSSAALSPTPSEPGNGLFIYTDPVMVTLSSTPDAGYSIAAIYYKLDGGATQQYTAPFTVSGTGSHSFEYWAVDNTGLEELPHKSRSFIINPQNATINYITQGGITIDVSVHFDNFAPYMAQLFNNDCYNDPGASFEIYNAVTKDRVSSQTREAHCGKFDDGNNWLGFPPLQLPAGTYFIHYHGGDGSEWITDTYTYVPHAKPTSTIALSPTPDNEGNYSNPVTVTLGGQADTGFSITNTYYKIDGGARQTYSAPFTVSGVGEHSIEYWSVDNSGVPGDRQTRNFTIIHNQPPDVEPLPNVTINEGVFYTAVGSFTDPDSSAWTATVDYDEGLGPETLPLNGNNFVLNNQYETPGPYTIRVVVTDEHLNTGTILVNVTVNAKPIVDPLPDAVINEGGNYTAIGSFTDADSDGWNATVDYGDGSGIQPLPLSDNNFSLNHQYKDNGTYTILVSVFDNLGASGAKNALVTVHNGNPVIETMNASVNPIFVNTNTTVSATFSDVGVLDTHTAVWDWGDTVLGQGTVTESNGLGSVSDSHMYTAPGIYEIKLTVTDKDTGADTEYYQYLTVFNPSSDKVAGSKEYNSPAGAVVGNPSLTGKMDFGFRVEYINGSLSQSSQDLELNFPAANINFVSDAYQWLVVVNQKATFKVTGTYNGVGGHTALISAIDQGNGSDKGLIRVQIKAPNNTVIYDTQPGAADTANPTLPVSKGKISVQ